MARREDDKCASYGSLFIGQSSGRASVKARGPVGAGEAGEIRCEIRLAPKQVWTLWGRAEKPTHWKGGYWGGQFTPRGTTYVFVNVVVAPRYVARVQPGSGGLSVVVSPAGPPYCQPGGAGHASLSSTPLVPRGSSASRREDTALAAHRTPWHSGEHSGLYKILFPIFACSSLVISARGHTPQASNHSMMRLH